MAKRDLIRNILVVIVILAIIAFIEAFYFSTYKVKEKDVNQFLKAKQTLVYNKKETPKIDDFVIYKVEGKTYLSRMIASSGDTVTSMDDVLYINNKVNKEPYIESLKTKFLIETKHQTNFTTDFTLETLTHSKNKTVPKGYLFVLNDNRQNYQDSREFGFIKKSQIKGVANFKLFPLSEFGFLDTK